MGDGHLSGLLERRRAGHSVPSSSQPGTSGYHCCCCIAATGTLSLCQAHGCRGSGGAAAGPHHLACNAVAAHAAQPARFCSQPLQLCLHGVAASLASSWWWCPRPHWRPCCVCGASAEQRQLPQDRRGATTAALFILSFVLTSSAAGVSSRPTSCFTILFITVPAHRVAESQRAAVSSSRGRAACRAAAARAGTAVSRCLATAATPAAASSYAT